MPTRNRGHVVDSSVKSSLSRKSSEVGRVLGFPTHAFEELAGLEVVVRQQVADLGFELVLHHARRFVNLLGVLRSSARVSPQQEEFFQLLALDRVLWTGEFARPVDLAGG